MNIILLGKPGSGKGSQAELMSSYYNIPHISTGDMFRQLANEGNKLGIMAKEKYWGKGNLVPDNITLSLVKERLKKKDCKKGFILDGFPRTITQAEGLEKISNISYVINIKCPDSLVIKRLSARRQCKKCGAIYGLDSPAKKEGICDKCNGILYQREDDKEGTVKKRLDVYNKQTAPLIEFYKKRKMLMNIDGSLPIQEVFRKIKEKIILCKSPQGDLHP
ncbi:adenylate kinase [archaeon]|nr:adenylate kinase [archaeon]